MQKYTYRAYKNVYSKKRNLKNSNFKVQII